MLIVGFLPQGKTPLSPIKTVATKVLSPQKVRRFVCICVSVTGLSIDASQRTDWDARGATAMIENHF